MRFTFIPHTFIALLICFAASKCLSQAVSVIHSSNLRATASRQSQILGSIEPGDTVTLTSHTASSGYYPAKTSDGRTGWILAKNVKLSESFAAMRATALGALHGQAFESSCDSPDYPGAPTAMDGTSCPAEGNGGAEVAQNEAKNNFCATGPASPITLDDLVGLQQAVQTNGAVPFGNPRKHPLTDAAGPATDRTVLQSIGPNGLGEGHEVTLVGYVKIARQEGAESVNCGRNVPAGAVYHDIHISIVDSPGAAECSGIVAEMIPHHRPASWTPALVNKVGAAQAQVRLTGNLMFDSSHTPCQGGTAITGDPSRESLWEVHPIYKFEVCTSGDCSSGEGWVDLKSWQPR